MITIPLSADALAATRFAVSPLMHAGALLHPYRPRTTTGAYSLSYSHVSGVLREQRLHLLAAVRQMVHAFAPVFYAPVFLTPPAAAGRIPEPHEDLHRVASAPSRVVARQLDSLLGVQSQHGRAALAALRILRRAADRGEADFANQLACELDRFWLRGLSRTWSEAAAGAAEDIALRTRLLADHGMAGALGSLHESVCYGDGALRMVGPGTVEVPAGGHLVLFPSPWAHTWLLSVDPQEQRPAYLIYPARPRPWSSPPDGTNRSMGGVIGPTRSALLADLEVARTTTQLAALHHLSASTVSYHLGLLHRAGLVSRTRTRNSVYYQRTVPAAALPRPVAEPASPSR
ncbi:ArsR/SmtB family transcription factor [Streptomyces sp. NPDC006925]|uniref:ArsR/SmtB family transcription factor n=1 Tax=Streptomyces sp. NPDC006925 TaxID=3364768 RepID=UPI0036CC5B53